MSKKTILLPKDHWKNAKRIWNSLSIQLGNKRTNQTYTEKINRNDD